VPSREDCLRNALISCSAAAIVLTASGLASAQNDIDTGPLPSPPAGAPEYNAQAPAIPFERIGTQGGSMRTLFQGAGPGNSRVEIRELIIGPRAVVELPPSGAALLDPRSGLGSVEAGGRTEQLSSGAVIAIAPDVPLAIRNSSEAALVVKLFIVEAR
jgi:hypothetical protein